MDPVLAVCGFVLVVVVVCFLSQKVEAGAAASLLVGFLALLAVGALFFMGAGLEIPDPRVGLDFLLVGY